MVPSYDSSSRETVPRPKARQPATRTNELDKGRLVCRRGQRPQRLLRLDIGSSDDPRSLVSLVRYEFCKVAWRCNKRSGAETGDARPDCGIGKSRVYLCIQFLNNFRRRILGRCNSSPRACLEAFDKLSHGRRIGQRFRAGRGSYRQSAQFTCSDLFDRSRKIVECTRATCPPSRSVTIGAEPR